MRKCAEYMMIAVLLLFAACGTGGETVGPTDSPATESPSEAPTETPALTKALEETSAPTPTNTATPEPTATPTEIPAEPTAVPTEAADGTETKVVLGDYIGMILYNVTQAEVDAEIESILADFAEYVVAERPAELGDIANINYVGKLDGVPFLGGTDDSAEGTDLELGSGSFIDGFEEGLVGAVAGEVRDLELTFPENYHSADMAGKTAVFTVTVNEVYEIVYPELTDEFVSTNLSGGMTAEEFRQIVFEELRWETLANQALEQLMTGAVLETYPEEEVIAEATEIINMYVAYAQYYASILGADVETMLQYFGFADLTALEEYAYTYVEYMMKSSLVIAAVATEEGIVLTEEIYAERALEYAYSYGYGDIATFETDYNAEEIREAVLFDLVLEYIVAKATIVEEN